MPAPRLTRPGFWPGRSNVVAKNGMICTAHPLASAAGLDVLRRGGSAIDAAIAADATMGAVSPLNAGVGGDLFALYWSSKTKTLRGLNASGRSPENLSWRTFARKGVSAIPNFGWPSVTVPGCVDGWWQLHQSDGKLPWGDLFTAAIAYCRDGAPVNEAASAEFQNIAPRLQNDAAREVLTPHGKPPAYGQLFKQPDLGTTLEAIANDGRDEFYLTGIAGEIARSSEAGGGFLALHDLTAHASEWTAPLKTHFAGLDVFELPPNSPGFTSLLALNILSSLDLEKLKDDWTALAHSAIEAVKLACAENSSHNADTIDTVPLEQLLSLTFATHAGLTVDPARAIARPVTLIGPPSGDTSCICAADSSGNIISLISSIGQGSGIVVERTGIHLQNRAAWFTLEDGHPNRLQPRKRPGHTLMPALALQYGAPYLAFGSVGAGHQPQAHVQFLINFLLHNMTLQEAVSSPRFDFRTENYIAFESDFPGAVQATLAAKGHKPVENDIGPFGGMQALRILPNGNFEGASDPRKDGCALGI